MEPRLWLSEATRRNFGRQERVEVVAAGNRKEAAQILAAHAQHLVCLEVKRYLDNTGSTIAALASYLGDKPDTLQRKFRGEQQASLADMVQWLSATKSLRRFERIWDAVASGRFPKVGNGSEESWNHLEEATTLRERPTPPRRGP